MVISHAAKGAAHTPRWYTTPGSAHASTIFARTANRAEPKPAPAAPRQPRSSVLGDVAAHCAPGSFRAGEVERSNRSPATRCSHPSMIAWHAAGHG